MKKIIFLLLLLLSIEAYVCTKVVNAEPVYTATMVSFTPQASTKTSYLESINNTTRICFSMTWYYTKDKVSSLYKITKKILRKFMFWRRR